MKKLITALVATLLLITSLPANANKAGLKNSTQVPTLAVIDTAVDFTVPSIKEKLIHEVCILDWPSCPNNTKFMEGSGSTYLFQSILSTSNFSHGTQMVSIAIANNPNMNILFVRIIGNTSTGGRQVTRSETVPNALTWIYNNKDKYNIKAVSMSQGHHNLRSGSAYCPVTPIDNLIKSFWDVNIPVFFAAGNNRDYSRIDWPACSPLAIAVGGADDLGSSGSFISRTSNYDSNLIDMFASVSSPVIFPGGKTGFAYGTSVSTQIAAAKWLQISTAKPHLTAQQILDLIKSTSTPIKGFLPNQTGQLINSQKAINS
jgi:hypothetical protein